MVRSVIPGTVKASIKRTKFKIFFLSTSVTVDEIVIFKISFLNMRKVLPQPNLKVFPDTTLYETAFSIFRKVSELLVFVSIKDPLVDLSQIEILLPSNFTSRCFLEIV